MPESRTLPLAAAGIPIQTLVAEVMEGPDVGRRCQADSDTLSVGTAQGNDLLLNDNTVSRYHLELSRRAEGILVVDAGSKNGTYHGAVQIQRAIVPPQTVLRIGMTTLRLGDGQALTLAVHEQEALAGLRGRTPAMRRLLHRVEKAAQSDAAVLLVGESGTGKEVIAHALHDLGPRAQKPFVTVDCGALSPTLVASELFGHERGAFTGADRQHVGAFERAQGGTLFLDEIGELPAALQATLLGVVERRRIRRLGGRTELAVDVRVLSATHRDLRAEVNAGTFRLDLYYRLAVVVMQVPPLRERADDIPLLVEHFLREEGHDGPVAELFSPAALRSLAEHHWPGNVRELRNLIEATLAMGEAPALERDAAPIGTADDVAALPYKDARAAVLHDFERRYLTALLERAQGNVSLAAREARMDRSHLIDLLRRHQLRGG